MALHGKGDFDVEDFSSDDSSQGRSGSSDGPSGDDEDDDYEYEAGGFESRTVQPSRQRDDESSRSGRARARDDSRAEERGAAARQVSSSSNRKSPAQTLEKPAAALDRDDALQMVEEGRLGGGKGELAGDNQNMQNQRQTEAKPPAVEYEPQLGFYERWRAYLLGARIPESDLDMETIEELRMLTAFTPKELRTIRSIFLMLVKDSRFMTREEFLAIPSVAVNPLQQRLLVCFGFDKSDRLDFTDFAEVLAVFNNPSAPREQKLRRAFLLVDLDGDGQLSHSDITHYLELITAPPEGVELDLDLVAQRILEEGSSHPTDQYLSLADFIKIMGTAEFDDKLTIRLL